MPQSDEARHNEIPEHLEKEKGCGDDPKAANQPAGEPVAPDGKPYGNGRGPDGSGDHPAGELQRDQAAHQDRGQSVAEEETGRD